MPWIPRISRNGAASVDLHHKAGFLHFIQQCFCIVFHLVLQFVSVKRDHLIKIDLFAARQDADFASFFFGLRTYQHGSAQLCVFCKRSAAVYGMAPAQPCIAFNGKSGKVFQKAYRPVPPFIAECLMLHSPVGRQSNGQLCAFQLVFRQFFQAHS